VLATIVGYKINGTKRATTMGDPELPNGPVDRDTVAAITPEYWLEMLELSSTTSMVSVQ
jgi:hypothetical protein